MQTRNLYGQYRRDKTLVMFEPGLRRSVNNTSKKYVQAVRKGRNLVHREASLLQSLDKQIDRPGGKNIPGQSSLCKLHCRDTRNEHMVKIMIP